MTTETTQVINVRNKPWWRKPSRWLIGIGLLIVISILGGVASGTNGSLSAANSTIVRDKATITSLTGQVGSLTSQVNTLRGQLSTAQANARNAQATANAAAARSYASRKAQLDQRAATLKSEQNSIAAEEGVLQKNNISSDGNYVVGRDIKSGTWHTPGDGGSGDQCYYELDKTSNYGNVANIDSNANFDGPETVNVSSDYSFQINGPCTWYLTG